MRRRGMVVALVAALALSGCSSLEKVGLPGGADLGDDPYTVKVEFADVLDLVPQSGVRVNDVPVGRVDSVRRQGWHAVVTLQVNRKVRLPDNAIATIRQTNLLGEKFVSLAPPATGSSGRLSSGDVIPLARSGANPELEQVLGALSLVLNGGSIERVQVISRELSTAFKGRETESRVLIARLNDLVGAASSSRREIVTALEQVDRLARTTQAQSRNITAALDALPGALSTLDAQRDDLVRVLQSLSSLGDTATRVIRASTDATAADLAALRPVLQRLAATGDGLVQTLRLLPTFPFPDVAFGDDAADALSRATGDYLDVSLTFDTDYAKTFALLTPAERQAMRCALGATDAACATAGAQQRRSAGGSGESGSGETPGSPSPSASASPSPSSGSDGASTLLGGSAVAP